MEIVNTGFNEVNFTSFHNGVILASANDIESILGVEPIEVYDDKITYDWHLMLKTDTENIPFTIYDYKEYNVTKNKVIEYHIGTKTTAETETVVNYIKNVVGLHANVKKYPWML